MPVLERALSQGVMGQRQKILRSAVAAGIGELRVEAGRALDIRRRDLAEQMLELKGLRGKNTSVIKHMRSRIEQEQARLRRQRRPDPRRAFGAPEAAARGVRRCWAPATLKTEMAELTAALRQPGIKLGVRKAYAPTFDRLRDGPAQGADQAAAKSSRC